jgi:hypothetical protein
MSERIHDLIALTARAIQTGQATLSRALIKRLLEVAPNSPTALSLAAALDFSLGDINEAVLRIESALLLDHGNVSTNVEATRLYLKAGQPRRAMVHGQRVLDAFPEFPGLRDLYFKTAFANSDYRDFLSLINACVTPSVYLETGVENGRSFSHARGVDIAIGIDPQMGKVPAEFHEWGQLFEMTSDDFFANGHFDDICNDRRIDLAFIDGMHLFEYTLRDFINIERRAHDNSVVLIHDIIPMNIQMGARLRATGTWMGDVWKIITILKHHRPKLDVTVIDAGPSGLALIRGLEPANRVLSEKYASIVAELTDMPLEHGFLEQLKVDRIPAEESAIRRLLRS